MSYEEAISYIHGTYKFGIKLGLNNIKRLLELMGNPQDKLKYVHVAGTNGKGSTVTFISSILIESGYKVGIYTSPYIERFTERIRINGIEISEYDVARIAAFVKSKADIMLEMGEAHPTEFEIVTAIAFQYYFESGCDIVILEVGLGGRYDSTNIINTPLVSVITTISLDHVDILGDTLEKIAYEKAGIIKKDGDVVLYPQKENVVEVFRDVARNNEARLSLVDFSHIVIKKFDIHGQTFDYKGYKDLEISILGDHQVKNAAVALDAIEILVNKGFKIDGIAIKNGLNKARWPGRLEVLNEEPLLLIDGAHNKEGADILYNALQKYFGKRPIIFILGMMKDKDCKGVLKKLLPLSKTVISTSVDNQRAMEPKSLGELAKGICNDVRVCGNPQKALKLAMELYEDGDVVCVFGSLYLAGEIRHIYKNYI